MEVKFDAVYFPEDLNSETLTIEFQEFFSDSNDDDILFKGTLIDLIRKQDGSFVALFDVSLGLFPIEFMRLQLVVDSNQVQMLRKTTGTRTTHFGWQPGNLYIVAKVTSINGATQLEYQATSGSEDHANLDAIRNRYLIVNGNLVGFEKSE